VVGKPDRRKRKKKGKIAVTADKDKGYREVVARTDHESGRKGRRGRHDNIHIGREGGRGVYFSYERVEKEKKKTKRRVSFKRRGLCPLLPSEH